MLRMFVFVFLLLLFFAETNTLFCVPTSTVPHYCIPLPPNVLLHAHTRACALTRTHTHTHTQVRTHWHVRARTHSRTLMCFCPTVPPTPLPPFFPLFFFSSIFFVFFFPLAKWTIGWQEWPYFSYPFAASVSMNVSARSCKVCLW